MVNNPVKKYRRHLKHSDLPDTWQNILWCEWHHCHDGDYAYRLHKAIEQEEHNPLFKHNPRPYLTEVEVALRQGCRKQPKVKDVWGRRLDRLYREKSKLTSPEQLVTALQDSHWLERFIARHVLIYRGGEVVSLLEDLVYERSDWVKEMAIWILASIGTDTQLRLAEEKRNLLCLQCLTHCQKHWADIPWKQDIGFYGCRMCKQSREFFHCPDDVVAVLDNTWTQTYRQQGDRLYVNWSRRLVPFDFDRVEIIQAIDEEIERFAVQIGNDLDSFRQPRYKQMHCTVNPTCQVSKNSMRILEKMFGHVEQVRL